MKLKFRQPFRKVSARQGYADMADTVDTADMADTRATVTATD